MELQSDFAKNKNLLESSDKISHIEFSEVTQSETDSKWDKKFVGGKREREEDEWDKKFVGGKREREEDEWDKNKQWGKKHDDDDPWGKKLDQEKSDKEKNKKMTGGDDSLDYLNDYSSAQYNLKSLDKYEQDFYHVYDKARQYRERVMKTQFEMNGGEDKPKKKMPRTVLIMLAISAEIRKSGKYTQYKQPQLMKISKFILDDAKKQLGINEVTESDWDKIETKAMGLAKNPEKYIQQYESSKETTDKEKNSVVSSSRSTRQRFNK